MYNSDHTATECIGQKTIFFLLPPKSVDVLSRFIYTALWADSLPLYVYVNDTREKKFDNIDTRGSILSE